MTLKDVLEKSAMLLGLTVDFDSVGETEAQLSDCGKEVLSVLTGEYTDIKTTEKAVASDNKIYYTALSNDVKRIIKVERNGKSVKFNEEAQYFTVPENVEYTVTYAYNLRITALNSQIALPPKFSKNILAVAVAGEYCFKKGHYSEAEAYSNRYETALKNILRPSRSIYIGENL